MTNIAAKNVCELSVCCDKLLKQQGVAHLGFHHADKD